MSEKEGLSDEDGHFVLEGLSAETWKIRAEGDSACYEAVTGESWGRLLPPGQMDFVPVRSPVIKLDVRNSRGELVPSAIIEFLDAESRVLEEASWTPRRPMVAYNDQFSMIRIKAGRFKNSQATISLKDQVRPGEVAKAVLLEMAISVVRIDKIISYDSARDFQVFLIPSHEGLQKVEATQLVNRNRSPGIGFSEKRSLRGIED